MKTENNLNLKRLNEVDWDFPGYPGAAGISSSCRKRRVDSGPSENAEWCFKRFIALVQKQALETKCSTEHAHKSKKIK